MPKEQREREEEKSRGKRNFSLAAKQDQGGGSDRQAAARNCLLFPTSQRFTKWEIPTTFSMDF